MATKEEISFEPTATPNYPVVEGRWSMIWMGSLAEVPITAHSYQVPLYKWESEEDLQQQADAIGTLAAAAHPGCPDLKVVISRGSGQWEGMAAVHAEGSR